MNTRAIEELRKLVNIEGITRSDGLKAREKALGDWIEKWVVEISISQSIIKKNLTSEDQVAITNFVTNQIVEQMYDNCVKIEQKPNLIKVEGLVLRR